MPIAHFKGFYPNFSGIISKSASPNKFGVPDHSVSLEPKCENTVSNLSDNVKHVENEYHFVMKCSQYDQLRSEMFARIQAADFRHMNDQEKFVFLLTTQSVAKLVAQFIVDAFDERLPQF